MLKAPDGSPVAGVSIYPRPVDGRLISAAPEMLELLRRFEAGYLAGDDRLQYLDDIRALLKQIDG
jgi:hypothetical protein